jgi:hypothetical protein
MTTVKPFANNSLSVYSYEGFSFTISNPDTSKYSRLTTTQTSGIPPAYITKLDVSRAIEFSATSNGMVPGTQQFVITADSSTAPTLTSSNIVTINPGRFLDVSGGGSFVGSNYTFFAKESVPPIWLKAPFSIGTITSSPSLPPGLGFTTVDVCSVRITGTPTVTVPQANYLIIGKESGTSKTVSSTLPIVISNERIQTNITNGGIISGMTVGSAISPVTLTSIANGVVQYTWSSLPTGIYASDSSGTIITSPFFPSDPSKTLVIQGTPTLQTASNFIPYGLGGLSQSISVTRTTAPVLSTTVGVTFMFGETVLFDTVPNLTFFKGVTLDPSANYYRAAAYFTTNDDISNIFSPNLRVDLSLAFNGVDRAYLIGTPTVPTGSSNFTIRAVSSNAFTRDVSSTIAISNDSVTLTAPVDTCYNFIFSRDVDLSLNGYYPYPITFSATAASGKNIEWSAPNLSGTGLSLSATTGNSTTIVGTPTATASLRNLRVTATSFDTSETAHRDVSFAVLDDAITSFSVPYINDRIFIQNKAIDPIQFTATMLSGNSIRAWTVANVFPGITMTRSGLMSGTSTCNVETTLTPTFTLDTDFVSKTYTPTWGFANTKDVIIAVLPNTTETVPLTFSGVEFRALAYSGLQSTLDLSTSRAPYQGSNFSASFSGNYLQGDFSGIALLPKYRLGIVATAGTSSNNWVSEIAVNNAPTFVRHIVGIDNATDPQNIVLKLLRNTGPSVDLGNGYTYSANALTWSNAGVSSSLLSNIPYGIHDMAQSGDVIVAVLGSNMVRSADAGVTWSQIPSSNIQAFDTSGGVPSIPYYTANPLFGCIATDGSSNWLTIANGWDGASFFNVLRTSSNNGVTWIDTSLGSNFVNINSNTKLFYNNSRYFVAAGASASQPVLYADSGNITNWVAAGLTSGDAINDMAFSNNTAVVIGSNGSSSACYSSADNGLSWTSIVSPIPYSGLTQLNTIGYAYGTWVVGGANMLGLTRAFYSTDLVNWTQTGVGLGSGRFTACIEDGSAWIFVGSNTSTAPGWTAIWQPTGSISNSVSWGTGQLPSVSSKQITATTVSNGTPSLTFSILYNTSGFSFVSPTTSDYICWQYVPISTINIEANSTLYPSQAVYYFVDNLPDGLITTLIPFPTYSATITGTPATYSDAPQRVRVYAVTANALNLISNVVSIRTILPTVQKQQTSAGAWTSLIRQYTEVNAATTSRDNKVTPAIEYKLGEFTSPEPPRVTTAQSNCLC